MVASIYSMQGERIRTVQLKGSCEYRLSVIELPEGVYLLSLVGGRHCGTVKIVRQK